MNYGAERAIAPDGAGSSGFGEYQVGEARPAGEFGCSRYTAVAQRNLLSFIGRNAASGSGGSFELVLLNSSTLNGTCLPMSVRTHVSSERRPPSFSTA